MTTTQVLTPTGKKVSRKLDTSKVEYKGEQVARVKARLDNPVAPSQACAMHFAQLASGKLQVKSFARLADGSRVNHIAYVTPARWAKLLADARSQAHLSEGAPKTNSVGSVVIKFWQS